MTVLPKEMHGANDRNGRFRIDPRKYPKDKAYIGCLAIWGILVLAFTVASIHWQFWPGAAFGGLIFLAVIPYTVIQRNRVDVLEVRSDFLHVSQMNPKSSGFRLRRDSPLEITLEHVKDPAGDAGIESTSTLNLWDSECGFRRRTILGLWLSEEAKGKVLKDLVGFLIEHGFAVKSLDEIDKSPR